jgi:hypothetical protein
VGLEEVVEGYQRTLREIWVEKAAALARISATLEALLSDLRILRGQLAEAAPEARPALVERCRSVRERALQYRWYLEVQREAVGLCQHEGLDALYPIPAPTRD